MEDYDNSGTGQTLFASEHISTLSAQESSKIYELAKMANNDTIRNEINTITLDNFQKQVGRYLLDLKALKQDVSWRDLRSDSIYQAVLAIMQHYNGTQPTYDQMIARYEPETDKQSTYLTDREKTYQAMNIFDDPQQTSNLNTTSWRSWSSKPCIWVDCDTRTGSYINSQTKENIQPTQTDTLAFSDNATVQEVATQDERNDVLSKHPNQKIIVYASKPNCANCKSIAPSFPPSSDQTNTDTVYVHVDFMEMKKRSANSENLLNSYGIDNIDMEAKTLPIILKIEKNSNSNDKWKINKKNFYSVWAIDQSVKFKNCTNNNTDIDIDTMYTNLLSSTS